MDQAKRLKELEQENSKVKRLVAELSLDKQILQDITRKTSKPGAAAYRCGAFGVIREARINLADQERLMPALPVLGSQCTRRIALIEALSRTSLHASIAQTKPLPGQQRVIRKAQMPKAGWYRCY